MEKVYLKNGQEAHLVEKINNNKFIVKPIHTAYYFVDDNNDEINDNECEFEDEERVVTEIFLKAPIEKLDAEYKTIKDKVDKKNSELLSIQNKLMNLRTEYNEILKQKTSAENLIINKSEFYQAKRITIIDRYSPIDIKLNECTSFNISFKIQKSENKFSFYVKDYNSNYERNYSTDQNGFLFDKTDEEIDELIRQKVIRDDSINNGIYIHDLTRINDKYLTDKLLAKKNELLKAEKEKLLTEKEKSLKNIQEEIDNLKFK